jgi:hypothetical protein
MSVGGAFRNCASAACAKNGASKTITVAATKNNRVM